MPVGGSFVYLEPIYLQSTSSAFPQFTKIVVATPSTVVWANTLGEALQRWSAKVRRHSRRPARTHPGRRRPLDRRRRRVPGTPACRRTSTGSSLMPTSTSCLAQEAVGTGDYVTYGQEMEQVQAALDRLAELRYTGSPTP